MGKDDQYDVIIIGSGLAGLAAASRLTDESEHLNIAVVTAGHGATAYISGVNAVVPSNPWGNYPEQHAHDMFQAGYFINDPELVQNMCRETFRCVELLEKWGIQFATQDGQYLLRHTSGSTYPRLLCQTSVLLGRSTMVILQTRLLDRGVTFFRKTLCAGLLVEGGKIYGISTIECSKNRAQELYAPTVITAWGGIGNLLPNSTYPIDIEGRTLALAFEAGVSLIDLEFLEFEPMVLKWPLQVQGEVCPTALLGEGAYLLNNDHERFLLKDRPQGEAGSSKTLINRATANQLAAGKGSPHEGVYIDLRHIPVATLQSYPWFSNNMTKAGLDLQKDLLEVGPSPHSHSGGIAVNETYHTKVKGLFAAGEAVGGIHGACRLAGNAATQALVSGVLAAEGVCGLTQGGRSLRKPTTSHDVIRDTQVYRQIIPKIQKILGKTLGISRNGETLRAGIEELEAVLCSQEVLQDEFTRQMTLSGLLIAQSSLLRTESRGVHSRLDYFHLDPNWQCSVKIERSSDGEITWQKLPRQSALFEHMS